MSPLSGIQLPKPKDWQDFERKMRSLFALVLADPNTQIHGRPGQPQRGVDFWGLRNQDSQRLVAVQCKLSNDDITEAELKRELDKAREFLPEISEYYLVTTAPRDVKIQQAARKLTKDYSEGDQPTRIMVWGWEDIEEIAAKYPDGPKIFDPTYNPIAQEALDEARRASATLSEVHRMQVEAEGRFRQEQERGPPLSPPFSDGRPRLTFYGYELDFFGRAAELQELRAFASMPPNGGPDFAWWVWSGSAGQGKTRLAAKFCRDLMETGWRCGFLPQSTTYEAWDSWVVATPTLIVIDHLAPRAKEIGSAIASLSRAADRFEAPLRVLILERPFDPGDPWIDEFVPTAVPHDAAESLNFAYRPDGRRCRSLTDCTRHLAALAERDLIAIVENIFAAEQIPGDSVADPGAVVAWLRDVDPETRPLFLILAARALCNRPTQDLRQWSRQHLVEALLSRDFLLWQDTLGIRHANRLSADRKLFEDHLTLILAATIMSRTDRHLLEELQEFGIGIPERIQPDWIRVMTGDPLEENGREFVALKPDIVGECFVLERCTGSFGVDASRGFVRDQMTALLSASLAVAPRQTIDFVRRCSADFPQHVGLSLFASIVLPEGENANLGHFQDYSVHFGAIANMFARTGQEDLAEACLTTLISVGEGPPFANDSYAGEMISHYLAIAHFNRGHLRLGQQKLPGARQDMESCIRLSETSAARRGPWMRGDMERLRFTALRQRAIVDLESGNPHTAEETLDGILEDPTAGAPDRAEALLARATVKRARDDLDGAIVDLDQILEMGEESREQQDQARNDLARFLLTRSIRNSERGGLDTALADLDRALPLVTDKAPIWAIIRVNRCVLRMKTRQFDPAEADCAAVLQSPHTPADQAVKARMNRAQLRLWRRDFDGADADIQYALDAECTAARDRVQILLVRAQIRWNRSDQDGACEDLTAASRTLERDDELWSVASLLYERYGCSRLAGSSKSELE